MRPLIVAMLALIGAPFTAKAELNCTLTVNPVRFDAISGTSTGTFDARGAMTVSCMGSQGATIAACIEISPGAASGLSGQRLLSSAKGREALPVQIFQDATLARPWGMAAAGQAQLLQRSGDGPMTATAYLRAYLRKGAAAPGTYSADFSVTLRYGISTGAMTHCDALEAASSSAHAAGQQRSVLVPLALRKR